MLLLFAALGVTAAVSANRVEAFAVVEADAVRVNG
jgi:hypothetical protein